MFFVYILYLLTFACFCNGDKIQRLISILSSDKTLSNEVILSFLDLYAEVSPEDQSLVYDEIVYNGADSPLIGIIVFIDVFLEYQDKFWNFFRTNQLEKFVKYALRKEAQFQLGHNLEDNQKKDFLDLVPHDLYAKYLLLHRIRNEDLNILKMPTELQTMVFFQYKDQLLHKKTLEDIYSLLHTELEEPIMWRVSLNLASGESSHDMKGFYLILLQKDVLSSIKFYIQTNGRVDTNVVINTLLSRIWKFTGGKPEMSLLDKVLTTLFEKNFVIFDIEGEEPIDKAVVLFQKPLDDNFSISKELCDLPKMGWLLLTFDDRLRILPRFNIPIYFCETFNSLVDCFNALKQKADEFMDDDEMDNAMDSEFKKSKQLENI